ncbi:leucine-rich repeat domain-containing protein [Microcoleus sp. Pol7_A1]|uniref:leucine-rich repeat domain-containing protein n=1 Tax=Microcoleus sp. Pol7_A1 TaxID=2818893 RepID=UPI004040B6DF
MSSTIYTKLDELTLQKKEARRYWITKFPDAVLQLTNLKILKLSDYEITEILEDLGQLSNLTKLYLNNNQITEIPKGLGQLSNQIEADFDNNPISQILEAIELLSFGTQCPDGEDFLQQVPPQPPTVYTQVKIN